MSDEGIPLGERFAQLACQRARETAVVDDTGVALSWDELNRVANRLARAYVSRGVQFGDFVTLALRNCTTSVAAYIGCWKIGATPQLASWRAVPGELDALVKLADSALLVRDDSTCSGSDHVTLETLLGSSDDDSELPVVVAPAFKAPASGGSTGKPKLIVSTQPGRVDLGAARLYGLSENSVQLIPAPLYHNGPFSAAASGLVAGGQLVLMSKFDAEDVLRLVQKHRVTWLYLVPTMMNRIWRLPMEVREAYDLSSLQAVWHMAAPCPPWLKRAWIEWLGPDRVYELYGGTEGQAVTVVSGAEWLDHPGSVGRPYHGEIQILDAARRPVGPGSVGEVFMRPKAGTGPTYRYIGGQARSHEGWESLGDMGWFDDEGYLYLTDRKTDMILVGGVNVYPAEVEAAIEAYECVNSCAAIGLPDDDLGHVVHAIVEPAGAFSLDVLMEHLAEQLSPHKRPRTVELVHEPVRDDAGKVRRSALRRARLQVSARGEL